MIVTALLIGNTQAGDRQVHSRKKRAPLDVRNCDVSPPVRFEFYLFFLIIHFILIIAFIIVKVNMCSL